MGQVLYEAKFDNTSDEWLCGDRWRGAAPAEVPAHWTKIRVDMMHPRHFELCAEYHADGWVELLLQNLRAIYFAYLPAIPGPDGQAQVGSALLASKIRKGLQQGREEGKKAAGRKRSRGGDEVRTVDDARERLLQDVLAYEKFAAGTPPAPVELQLFVNDLAALSAADAGCFWDRLLGENARDCFPIYCKVETKVGDRSVTSTVIGAIFYFGVSADASDERSGECVPLRDLRVDMPASLDRSPMRFATMWMGRWLPNENFSPDFMQVARSARPCPRRGSLLPSTCASVSWPLPAARR